MSTVNTEEIKVRMTGALRTGLENEAARQSTAVTKRTLSDIARTAIFEYLKGLGYTADQLGESSNPPPMPPSKPVTYRKASKRGTRRKIQDIVEKRVDEVKSSRARTD